MRWCVTALARATPIPSAQRRLATSLLTARDEVLFNVLRQTVWRLLQASGDAKRGIALSALQATLSPELQGDLHARRTSLTEVLQRCPGWFDVTGNATVQLTSDAAALRDDHADVTVRHLSRGGVRGDAAAQKASDHIVRLAGPESPVVFVDTSRPILTAAEIETSRLADQVAVSHVPFRPNVPRDVLNAKRHTKFVDESVPEDLSGVGAAHSSELSQFDDLYRRKGYLAPSEVLNVMLEYVPSYYVELGRVFNALPMQVRLQFFDHVEMDRNGRYRQLTRPFRDYPMLFTIEEGSFRKTLVRLNTAFAFVTTHPKFGAANRSMRQFSKEFAPERGVVSRDTARFQHSAAVGAAQGSGTSDRGNGAEAGSSEPVLRHMRLARTSDLQLFRILLAHLPRGQGEINALCRFMPLTAWINSFPQSDIDLLNEVPQQRVLTLIARYRRIFQLSSVDGADPNLYSGWTESPWSREAAPLAPPASSAQRLTLVDEASVVNEGDQGAWDDDVDDAALSRSPGGSIDSEPVPETDATESTRSSHESTKTLEDIDAATKVRVSTFKAAMADELLGMDEILTSEVVQETFDRGGDDEGGEADDNDSDASREQQHNAAASDITTSDTTTHQHRHQDDVYVPSTFDHLCVRRLPPNIAPGSLCDLDRQSTPDSVLLEHVLTFLAPPPPPSTSTDDVDALRKWRWVPIETIYRAIPADQRFRMKRFRGLPNFIRLHGRVLEVSADVRHVILHDPSRTPPFIPTQKIFSLEERMSLPQTFDSSIHASGEAAVAAVLQLDAEQRAKFRQVLRDSQVPTDRKQLRFLEPGNPLLDSHYLAQEIAAFLPNRPVPMLHVIARLPPIMKAAMPSGAGGGMKFFTRYPGIFDVRYDGSSGKTMLARAAVGANDAHRAAPEQSDSSGKAAGTASPVASSAWSLSKSLQHIDEIITASGPRGISTLKLQRVLSRAALQALQREASTTDMESFVALYPERFELFSGPDERTHVRMAR